LPTKVGVEKKIVINAPVDTVYKIVNDFHYWGEWSPWYDTTKQYTITGADSGVGAVMRWINEKDMVGERTIETSEYPNLIKVVTTFRAEGSSADMYFRFKEPEAGKTEVTVSFSMDDYPFTYPFGRYVAWFIQEGANVSFPKALENLKKFSEGKVTGVTETGTAAPAADSTATVTDSALIAE
jgi:hypothetical protein